MDPVSNAQNGMLYDMDCSFLSTVRYNRDSPETITFIFSENPAGKLPKKVFLMPEGSRYDYRSYIYTLSDEISPHHTEQPPTTCYLVRGVTKDSSKLRKNLRVYISFRICARFDGQEQDTVITIKDIGTGGFLFISDQEFEPGATLSYIFSDINKPVFIRARIQRRRPVRREGVYGYGCQFIELSPEAESKIRNFVYQTEILQARTKDENLMF